MGAPEISVVIPVYNSELFICNSIRQLHNFLVNSGYTFEIITVNDASEDKTKEVLDELILPNFLKINHVENLGKYGAIKSGMREARGLCCIFTDADLPYEVESISFMADLIIRREFHIAIGDRSLPTSSYKTPHGWLRCMATRFFSLGVRMLITGGLSDTQCGLKAFRYDVAQTIFPMLRDQGFAGDVELLWIAQNYNLEIRRIPVRLQHCGPSTVRILPHGFQMLRRIATLHLNWMRNVYVSDRLTAIAHQDYETIRRSKT